MRNIYELDQIKVLENCVIEQQRFFDFYYHINSALNKSGGGFEYIDHNYIVRNERMEQQDGRFILMASRINKKDNLPFEEMYHQTTGKKISCLRINKSVDRIEVLCWLEKNGITEKSLLLN